VLAGDVAQELGRLAEGGGDNLDAERAWSRTWCSPAMAGAAVALEPA
jgi:hypothetical protein